MGDITCLYTEITIILEMKFYLVSMQIHFNSYVCKVICSEFLMQNIKCQQKIL